MTFRRVLVEPLASALRRGLFCAALLAAIGTPVAALADCCKCVGSDTTKNICLTITTGGCGTIQQQAQNTNISSLTCETTAISSTLCSTKPQGICDAVSDATTYNPNPTAAPGQTISPIVPELNVPIPGLTLSVPSQGPGGSLQVSFLAQYISAAYKYLFGISVIAAAVMIVYGGFKYILGSTALSISSGKETIQDAIIGLFLLFASYTLLSVLNPATVAPTALSVTVITADESWINDHGTGDPFASTNALEQSQSLSIPGVKSPSGTFTAPTAPTTPTPGQPQVPVETVDVSKIPFDKSLGGPANLNSFCTTKAEASQATTYQDKVKLLVKAVMGFYKTCVQNQLCVYCQGCATTIPGGQITAGALPTYIMQGAIQRGMTDPEHVWGPVSSCNELYNDPKTRFQINSGECAPPVKDFYQKKFVDVFTQNKLYAADCGGFAMTLLSCAGTSFSRTPTEKAYDNNTKKFVNTAYLSPKSLTDFMQNSNAVLAGHMNDNLLGLAAKKGGLQFGDLIYTCCGGAKDSYSAHWLMYTGGRPDVPFSFIEMGGIGANVNVPGIPQGVSTVQTKPASWTLQDYINSKTSPIQLKTTSGKIYGTIPASTNPATGVIYVWRPYGDAPGAPGGSSP